MVVTSKKIVKTTKEIESEYNISRQTIHTWIKEGLLKSPKKGYRQAFVWEKEDEINLKELIRSKSINSQQSFFTEEKLKISNRRYLGSKQKLIDFIDEVVRENTENIRSVADIFAGTGVVADLFNSQGKKVIVNDILRSNVITYQTWFGNESVNMEKIENIINELNELEDETENYVSINFGDKYFSMENAKKIGHIREKIETYNINERERAFLLTSLLYAMDKVANTVGHYDAYRKNMDSTQPIFLRVPMYKENMNNEIYNEDANTLVRKLKVDLVYIDTPYNSRQYGDAYHLLENIIEWNKPKLEGIAMKMINRKHIKSDYSTQKAPQAFADLIQNIDAKYILVSYNNMAQKGNGRSNAKISNEEILEILGRKGTVEVFDRPFKVFTTGKTKIEDHRELLYLCKVKPETKIKESYIKSAINYTGGKYKLLNQILPLFPLNMRNFYDVFAGGANVAININNAKKIIINDIESNVINLYKFIQEVDYEKLLLKINEIIKQYNLSDTKNKGYDYYNVDSSNGLKDINKEGYEKLRSDYNIGKFSELEKPIIFYILIVYGFNNQIRFNSSGEFNMPTGKRDFNNKMENKLKSFKKALSEKNIQFESKDFRELLDEITDEQDFVYLDPPYLISTASYNENGGWGIEEEKDLLVKINELNNRKVKFALSNVLRHKGKENNFLKEWLQENEYNVHFLDYHYNNSNYQSTAKDTETIEILVTNY